MLEQTITPTMLSCFNISFYEPEQKLNGFKINHNSVEDAEDILCEYIEELGLNTNAINNYELKETSDKLANYLERYYDSNLWIWFHPSLLEMYMPVSTDLMYKYYRIVCGDEVLYGSYLKSECNYELRTNKADWKEEYEGEIKITVENTVQAPDEEVYCEPELKKINNDAIEIPKPLSIEEQIAKHENEIKILRSQLLDEHLIKIDASADLTGVAYRFAPKYSMLHTNGYVNIVFSSCRTDLFAQLRDIGFEQTEYGNISFWKKGSLFASPQCFGRDWETNEVVMLIGENK